MPGAGSFGRVCLDYYASPAFKNLDDSTKNWLRSHLDAISIEHGNKLIEQMAPKHVEKLMQQKAAKPAAANKRLKALKALFRWAIRVKLVSHNPTVGVEKVVYQTRGHPAWSMEEIATYRAKHPVGKQARLAMELMFYTACRREDAVRGIANGSVASVSPTSKKPRPLPSSSVYRQTPHRPTLSFFMTVAFNSGFVSLLLAASI